MPIWTKTNCFLRQQTRNVGCNLSAYKIGDAGFNEPTPKNMCVKNSTNPKNLMLSRWGCTHHSHALDHTHASIAEPAARNLGGGMGMAWSSPLGGYVRALWEPSGPHCLLDPLSGSDRASPCEGQDPGMVNFDQNDPSDADQVLQSSPTTTSTKHPTLFEVSRQVCDLLAPAGIA